MTFYVDVFAKKTTFRTAYVLEAFFTFLSMLFLCVGTVMILDVAPLRAAVADHCESALHLTQTIVVGFYWTLFFLFSAVTLLSTLPGAMYKLWRIAAGGGAGES